MLRLRDARDVVVGRGRFPVWSSSNRQRRSRTLEPRLNVITLAVDDLERALVFYRDGLGLETKGVVAADAR